MCILLAGFLPRNMHINLFKIIHLISAELAEKIEHIEKNYTFLMTKQNTLDDFITTIGKYVRDLF